MKSNLIDLASFSAEEKMTRVGGEKLRKMILSLPLPVTLKFGSKPIASVSFLDEGLAKLIQEGWTKEKISTEIQLQNIHPRDLDLLKDLIRAHLKK